jgi:hypothetical protein
MQKVSARLFAIIFIIKTMSNIKKQNIYLSIVKKQTAPNAKVSENKKK